MNPIIQTRRSVRRFRPDITLTQEQLDELLRAALLAPSAYNNQPWEFIAVTNRERLRRIAEALPNAVPCATASAAIVIVAVPKHGRLEGYYPPECGAAAQNVLLQATDSGLGSCWCGVWPLEERIATIRTLLEVPENKVPFCVIAVGLAEENPRPRKNLELAKVVRYLV